MRKVYAFVNIMWWNGDRMHGRMKLSLTDIRCKCPLNVGKACE